MAEIQYTPEARAEHERMINARALAAADAALEAARTADPELSRLRAERDTVTKRAAGVELEPWEPGASRAFPEQHDTIEALAARRLGTARAAAALELPARLAEVQALTNPDTLARAFDEAALAGHGFVTRAIGRVVAEKLAVLERDGPASTRATASRAGATFRQTFAAWERAHPSELDQVQRLNDRIEARERQLRASASWALRFGGLIAAGR